uniref:Uncharacterized protein n=1 Tax=Oryza punctata TaxID=4537 RepID=A0A0E0KNN3_ORYPU
MASTPPPPPPPVIGKAGNLTVFITPPSAAEAEGSPDSPRSEFTTPSGSPRAAEDSPPSVPQLATPPPVKTVSPPLPAAKLSSSAPKPPPPVQVPLPSAKLSAPRPPPPPPPPPVQVPPPQFEKAEARPDGSMLALFWDTVARVQEGAHASLDEYISNWFGLDQSKYQWALNEYYESNGKDMESGKAAKPKELSSKMQV